MKILMIEDEIAEVQRFKDYFETQDDMMVIGATGSLSEGLQLTQKHLPDAVLLDLELDEGFGMQYLPRLRKLELPFQPYVIVTTWTSESRTLRNLKDNGAGFVQIKSKPGYSEYGPQMVAEVLREMRPYFKEGSKGSDGHVYHTPAPADQELRDIAVVKGWLGEISITTGRAGQDYLAFAIVRTAQYKVEHKVNPLLDKEIYPEIEEKFHLRPGSAEKTMRCTVETAWGRADPETLARKYTQYISPNKGKPALKDFISYYAEKLLMP